MEKKTKFSQKGDVTMAKLFFLYIYFIFIRIFILVYFHGEFFFVKIKEISLEGRNSTTHIKALDLYQKT